MESTEIKLGPFKWKENQSSRLLLSVFVLTQEFQALSSFGHKQIRLISVVQVMFHLVQDVI